MSTFLIITGSIIMFAVTWAAGLCFVSQYIPDLLYKNELKTPYYRLVHICQGVYIFLTGLAMFLVGKGL